MTRYLWKAAPALAVACCGLATLGSQAQQAPKPPTPVQTALVEYPAPPEAESGAAKSGSDAASTAATAPAAPAASTDTPAANGPAATVAAPATRDLVIKELSEMKARI